MVTESHNRIFCPRAMALNNTQQLQHSHKSNNCSQ